MSDKKSLLVEDWHWIVNHSWSMRFIVLAFVLTCTEAALPLFTETHMPPNVFAIVIGLVTGSAFVARLLAQNRKL